jgi:hypothetical protein
MEVGDILGGSADKQAQLGLLFVLNKSIICDHNLRLLF